MSMSQVTLVNKSGIVIKAGDFVKINRADPDLLSFLYAEYYEADVMGTAAADCAPNKKCVINLFNTVTWGDEGNTSTRTVTETTTELITDYTIICDSVIAMTVNLLPATGSGRIRQMGNINTGDVSVEGDSGDTINDELNQTVSKDDCMSIKDYGVGKWIII
jgi:hypothetical protein